MEENVTSSLARQALICHILETLIREPECYARHESYAFRYVSILYRNFSRTPKLVHAD